jgi:hypothetical protein
MTEHAMPERRAERRHTVRREADRSTQQFHAEPVVREPVRVERTDVTVRDREGALGYLMHDRVSWGAIWGGFLTAMGVFLLLSLLAAAIGLTTIDAGAAEADTLNRWAGVASGVIALISFVIGGYVAGRMGAFVTPTAGMMNGFLVWALANLVMLGLAAFGLGQLFGAAGELYNEIGALQGQVNVNEQQLVTDLRNSAWIAFLGMALGALAAALGGLLGTTTRGPVPDVDPHESHV